MNGSGQLIPFALPSITFAAGSRTTIQLRDIPAAFQGRIVHLVKLNFDCEYTPNTTALPTVIGDNNLFTSLDFTDGQVMRHIGGLNNVRILERYNTGRIRVPDADNGADDVQRFFRKTLHMGPPQMAGYPTDFAYPAGALGTAQISVQHGAVTDLAADCTSATGSARVIAWCILLDEVRVPPAYQVFTQVGAGSTVNMTGKALYVNLALENSALHDAITAADFSNITLDLGQGAQFAGIAAESLMAGYQDDFAPGEVGTFLGEPEAATVDDNGKIVNRASPTAVAAAPADLQPVVWAPPGCKISKLPMSEANARITTSGGQTTSNCIGSRILEQPPSVVSTVAGKALNALNRREKSAAIKTLSKKPYVGPYKSFMPWTFKV